VSSPGCGLQPGNYGGFYDGSLTYPAASAWLSGKVAEFTLDRLLPDRYSAVHGALRKMKIKDTFTILKSRVVSSHKRNPPFPSKLTKKLSAE